MSNELTSRQLEVGPGGLTISNVQTPGGRTGAELSGELSIGDDLKLAVSYDSSDNLNMRGTLPDVSLTRLIALLTNQEISLPDDFDLTLTNSSVLIRKTAAGLVFQLTSTIQEKATVLFEARRVGIPNLWGFAACIDMADLPLSSLPGLKALEMFENVFELDELRLVVSSFEDSSFKFPNPADFNGSDAGKKEPKLSPQTGVIRGLNVYARWKMDDSHEQKLLREFLHIDEPSIGIIMQVGANPARDSRLYASLDTTIEGHSFSCRFGGQIKDSQVGLFLTGSLETVVQEQPLDFEVSLLFVPTGAFVSGAVTGSISFEGLTLSNLVLVMGVNWEGIPSLGIAASLAVKNFQSSLAIFFDSTYPSRSMAAGSVSGLSLKEVLDTFAGDVKSSVADETLSVVKLAGTSAFTIDAKLADALDNFQVDVVSAAFGKNHVSLPPVSSQVLIVAGEAGKNWALTDLKEMLHYELTAVPDGISVVLNPQFYCVPQTTSIGPLRFEQGVFINTALEILSFDAMAKILVKLNKGISVDGAMNRIVIGTKSLFSFESGDGEKGPRISIATFAQPEMPEKAFRDPHILIDGQVNILGMKRQAYAALNRGGFEFHVAFSPVPLVSFDLAGHFSGPADLSIEGAVKIGLGSLNLGKLGSIDIETNVGGELSIGVTNSDIWAKFEGEFEFAGERLKLPPVNLDVNSASLPELPGKIRVHVEECLSKALLDDAEKWLKLLDDGVIKGVENAAGILKTTFEASAEQVGELFGKNPLRRRR